MLVHKEATKETYVDLNLKVYREMDFGRLWAGLSLRGSYDNVPFIRDTGAYEKPGSSFITPMIGVEYNSYVFAYSFNYQSDSIIFNNGGYHQITLGFNLGCRKKRYNCNCPWLK